MAENPKPPTGDAHRSPPEFIKSLHKHYQKASIESLATDPRVLDFTNLSEFYSQRLRVVGKLPGAHLRTIFSQFETGACCTDGGNRAENEEIGNYDRLIYEHELLPGMSPIFF